MAFDAEQPHILAAVVLSGYFSQLGDPLDWLARGFLINTKVDRGQLAESLASSGGAGMPCAEARGVDKTTRFKIEVVGKCEGKMVAKCRMTIDHRAMTYKTIEQQAIELAVLNPQLAMGFQATRGRQSDSLDGVELDPEDRFLRLYPLNVFGRAFFKQQIAAMQRDKKVRVVDVGEAALVELTKAWLFYDVGAPSRQMEYADNLLPFNGKW